MMKTSELLASCRYHADDKWVPALPMPAPFWLRLRDAWAVLRGRAEAVVEG